MKIILFWKPGIWLIIICYLSLMPGNNIPYAPLFNIPHFDKIVHFGFYLILSLLLIKPISKTGLPPYITTFAIAGLISGLIEIFQDKLTISRHGNIYDFIANIAGALIALILFQLFIKGNKIERLF